MLKQEQIVVIGSGIVGLSTAFSLLRQNMGNVTIVERNLVGHERAASHGMSRLLRFEYGADQFYTEMVQVSLQRWRELEELTQRSLYTPTGVLVMGSSTDDFAKKSYDVLHDLGYPCEFLSRNACRKRFPQFALQDYEFFTFNGEGGILHASYCLQTLKDTIRRLGGVLLEKQQAVQVNREDASKPIRVRLMNGHVLNADRLVLAVGPWVHHLLGDLHLPVRLTRQYTLFFDNLPVSLFGPTVFPAFIAGELYGFPMYSHAGYAGPGWFKVASHTFGADVDPDSVEHIESQVICEVMYDLYRLLPDLRQANLVNVDSCIYDVSADEHFILDVLPDDPRVVFATGLSGHGFKFGLLLGEMLSSFVCGSASPVDVGRFRLSRFH